MSEEHTRRRLRRLLRSPKGVLVAAAIVVGSMLALPLGALGDSTYNHPNINCPHDIARGLSFTVDGSGFPGGSIATGSFETVSTGSVTPAMTSGTGDFSAVATMAPTATLGNHVLRESVGTVSASCSIKAT